MGNMEPTLNFDSRFISDCIESCDIRKHWRSGFFSGNNSPSGSMVCFENTAVVNAEDKSMDDNGDEDTPIDLIADPLASTETCEGTTVNHCVKVISHHSKDGIQIHKWESRYSTFHDVNVLKA